TQILRVVQANARVPPGTRGSRARAAAGAGAPEVPGAPGAGIPGMEGSGLAGDPGVLPAGLSPTDRLATDPANIVNLLRIPGEQQVSLRVTVAEVNRAAARSIGINFDIFNKAGVLVFGQNTGNIFNGGGSGGTGSTSGFGSSGGGAFGTGGAGSSGAGGGVGSIANNLPLTLFNGQVPVAINALRNMNYARSLAEPNLLALNGQTARFQAGGQFPVPIVTGTTLTGLQGVQFIPYGVQLTFTPFITDRDRIRLSVSASVSTRDESTGAT